MASHWELDNNELFRLLTARFDRLERLVHRMADATQAELDADTAAITDAVSKLGNAVTAIQSELDNLKAAHPELDASALDAAVAQLGNSVSAVQGLAPAAPAAGAGDAPAVSPTTGQPVQDGSGDTQASAGTAEASASS